MSTFSIPNSQKQVRQVNRGDLFGELWATFNCDLVTSPGKIKSSKRLTKVLDDGDLAGEDVVAIDVYNGNYYLTTAGDVLTCDVQDDVTNSANWISEGTLGSEDLGFESDSVSFDGKIMFSLGTDIMSYNGGTKDDDWWTATVSGTALTEDKPHIMHVHRGGQETFIVTDGNKIRYYNATAGHSTITLDTTFTASCLSSGVSAVWAGTYTEQGSQAYVYEFYIGEQLDGAPVARNAYPVDGRAVLSIEVIDNTPYIITEKGNLQMFNGVGFVTVASFPFAYQGGMLDGVRAGVVQDTSISRPVHPKGMKARNKSIYIAINTEDMDSLPINERSASGIWEYDSETGVLNHRNSLTDGTDTKGVSVQRRSSPLFIADAPETVFLVGGETSGGIGLWAESTVAPYSYFITPEIESQTIQDAYEKVILKARTLAEDEAIVVKYRTSKNANYPQYNDIVWLNATQFTTTDVSFSNASVGDEVEVIEGYRAGHLAHIEEITGTTTFTVTIDQSLGVLNELSTIRLQNWKKLPTEYTGEDGEFKSIGVGQTKPWIQYKVQLKGDIEFRQLISKGNSKTEI